MTPLHSPTPQPHTAAPCQPLHNERRGAVTHATPAGPRAQRRAGSGQLPGAGTGGKATSGPCGPRAPTPPGAAEGPLSCAAAALQPWSWQEGWHWCHGGGLCGINPAAVGATLRLGGSKCPRLPGSHPVPASRSQPRAWHQGTEPPPGPGAGGCHRARPHSGTRGRGLGAPTPRPLVAGSPRDLLPAGQVSHSRRETESRGGEASWQHPCQSHRRASSAS